MNQTLFFRLEQFMQEKKWSKTDLAKHSGIHLSDISRIFNHKQPLSLQILDAITKAFGLEEAALYTDYIEECFNENQHLDKRRTIQFLYKCASEGFEQLSHSILNAILEEKSKTIRNKNLMYIFSVAEMLFKDGKEKEAYPLYEIIIETMPNRFSETLAISYLRRFHIVRLTEEGQQALSYVLEQLAYMPIDVKMDAYFWITAFYYRREQWREVLYYAEKLEAMVNDGEYYGRALQYKSFALRRLGGSLDEVLSLTDRYAQINEFFADIAVGNRLVALLDYDFLEYVDEYLIWLENRDDIYMGLPRLLETYVELDRLDNAETLLKRFKPVIDDISVSKEFFKQQAYLRYRYALSLYLCKCKCFQEGMNELLEVANSAKKIGNMEMLKRCFFVFWTYRDHVTIEQDVKYKQLLH
ncbi:helix-turn-helix domain-containing protein [Neobacillus niacini]|uniref:helix-turn-helix domain-containing protein n=1 Tax=Neobacillus niacini TaxID=86668 RepID=UPI0005F02FA0|nr:helix-turn-helix transcriptional regulator [Neobacillus niacini]